MLTEKDKMYCDFVVRYGNDTSTRRGFHDTYVNALKEFNSITLNAKTTWKQLIWEPLSEPDKQEVIKDECVKIIEIPGATFIIHD